MAKEARVSFAGDVGPERVMTVKYPAIGKELQVPVGQLSQYQDVGDYTAECLDHGWKQRFGDFRALDKDMTDAEKDRAAYERASAYVDHLSAGGDWKMTPERDNTGEVLDAMARMGHKRDMLEKALAFKPEQIKTWRADAKVKAMIAKIRSEKAAKLAKESDSEIEIEVPEETE